MHGILKKDLKSIFHGNHEMKEISKIFFFLPSIPFVNKTYYLPLNIGPVLFLFIFPEPNNWIKKFWYQYWL